MSNEKFNLRKNVRISVISFVINVVLVFVSYRFVIMYEGIEAVGLWSLLMAWGALIRIGDVGMGGAILRFISTKNIEYEAVEIRAFIDTGLIMNFVAFLILTLLGYALVSFNLASLVHNDMINQAQSVLPIMFMGIFFSTMSAVLIASLQGVHLGYIGSYLTVGGNLLQIFFVLLLVPKMGLLGLAWSQLIQFGLISLLGWIFIVQKIKIGTILPVGFSFLILREMFAFSLKAQVANVANGLFEPVSKILFSQFGSLQGQGFYELAYKTVSLTRNVVVSGLFASLPTLTNLIHSNLLEAQIFYKKSQKHVTKAVSVVMISVIVFSPLVSWVWMGKFEMDYWLFVVCISFGFWVNTLGATAYNLGLATGIMKNNIMASLSMLAVLVIVAYLLGYFYQSVGVGIATGMSLAFGGLLIKRLNEQLIFMKSKIVEIK